MQPQDFASLPASLTFTVDVEDHRPRHGQAGRYERQTERLLDFLDRHGGRGTFFVVGEVAERSPALVRAISARGHEIASHSHRHVTLDREEQHSFGAAAAAARRRLEDLTGSAVLGFRAPQFSLTPATLWAVEAIREAGFAYSSSVLPAWNPGYGFPGAPAVPFHWPNGLLEIPCPVARIGPLALPFLGGMYLRYLPPWRLRRFARSLTTPAVWTYCHPYDVDTDEPFTLLHGKDPLSSLFLWANRGTVLHRLDLLLRGRRSLSFAERCTELAAQAATFVPPRRFVV